MRYQNGLPILPGELDEQTTHAKRVLGNLGDHVQMEGETNRPDTSGTADNFAYVTPLQGRQLRFVNDVLNMNVLSQPQREQLLALGFRGPSPGKREKEQQQQRHAHEDIEQLSDAPSFVAVGDVKEDELHGEQGDPVSLQLVEVCGLRDVAPTTPEVFAEIFLHPPHKLPSQSDPMQIYTRLPLYYSPTRAQLFPPPSSVQPAFQFRCTHTRKKYAATFRLIGISPANRSASVLIGEACFCPPMWDQPMVDIWLPLVNPNFTVPAVPGAGTIGSLRIRYGTDVRSPPLSPKRPESPPPQPGDLYVPPSPDLPAASPAGAQRNNGTPINANARRLSQLRSGGATPPPATRLENEKPQENQRGSLQSATPPSLSPAPPVSSIEPVRASEDVPKPPPPPPRRGSSEHAIVGHQTAQPSQEPAAPAAERRRSSTLSGGSDAHKERGSVTKAAPAPAPASTPQVPEEKEETGRKTSAESAKGEGMVEKSVPLLLVRLDRVTGVKVNEGTEMRCRVRFLTDKNGTHALNSKVAAAQRKGEDRLDAVFKHQIGVPVRNRSDYTVVVEAYALGGSGVQHYGTAAVSVTDSRTAKFATWPLSPPSSDPSNAKEMQQSASGLGSVSLQLVKGGSTTIMVPAGEAAAPPQSPKAASPKRVSIAPGGKADESSEEEDDSEESEENSEDEAPAPKAKAQPAAKARGASPTAGAQAAGAGGAAGQRMALMVRIDAIRDLQTGAQEKGAPVYCRIRYSTHPRGKGAKTPEKGGQPPKSGASEAQDVVFRHPVPIPLDPKEKSVALEAVRKTPSRGDVIVGEATIPIHDPQSANFREYVLKSIAAADEDSPKGRILLQLVKAPAPGGGGGGGNSPQPKSRPRPPADESSGSEESSD
uniref:C2 domain-containing protein n=1 Tax=Chromera velia CCMP2878 TaxID=1169474 RepID=A0A0G4FJ24_9ALVE|eukprot:Cvel_17303.t1-p1 / transcript=Cvel_17303.t1 / gene=Cvel_17303 / organism=Chromera_velia_CCMP2878 / gene_product=hypothetical protein / transcript_product=hypothetical protein / location=Cvel_scaffold1373:41050-47317(-) / protein_length=879 / sequence_SO=supercontig / SO=protein_coding / is_pseudo=false